MSVKPTIEFFPVDNGDMVLITTANSKRILIDCNYRQSADIDVKEILRERLVRDNLDRLYLDVFVSTHPDLDHVRGFSEIFHTGSPDDWNLASDKVIINEIWSSPRVFRRASRKPINGGTGMNELCQDAKDLNKEAKRRAKLFKDSGYLFTQKDGDGIVILTEDEDGKTEGFEQIVAKLYSKFVSLNSGLNDNSIDALLLGPADKQDVPTDEDELCKNDSSVILNICIKDEYGFSHQFLTGGDAGVKCWELLNDRMVSECSTPLLSYDVLQTPHHCSWRSISDDSESNSENPKVNESAKGALSYANSNAMIVTSSRPFGEKTPPSKLAKSEYEDIVSAADGEFLMVSDQTDSENKGTSLVITFSCGSKSSGTGKVSFANSENPNAVNKSGRNIYA
ncbi:hypothetical protein GCM10007978_12480 [Shewanella hanedai]|uniref:Cobalamin biosynthesis protein CobQ n=1 Tax=Shewanella hanedai TaxID=25 RepID=A0A553JQN7_SHEHA|nr:cobalamin biosynthesis protein CobQ [Shewanella hanedai]TRY14758.1 cobalamin biosynthesis protein CobQ [Shewanella hanedai]GGI76411.1 hypothetical protein GCM10007978_12480 [Shewanella hanedai]